MPTITITEEMIRPNTGDSSSWFSTVRGHYARQRNGRQNLSPSASDFTHHWNTLFRSFRHNFERMVNIYPTDLELNKQIIKDVVGLPSSRFGHNYSTYAQIIGMFNVYASVRKQMDFSTRSRIDWKVDFICSVGESYIDANRWEAKFHGRCMFNMKFSTFDSISVHLRNGEIRAAWDKIFELYDAQRYYRSLAHPRYLQNGTQNGPIRAGTADRSTPAVPRPPQPISRRESTISGRTIRYNPTGLLAEEYLARQHEEEEGIISTRELGRMLANSQFQFPADFRELFYELMISMAMFDPQDTAQTDESMNEFMAILTQRFNVNMEQTG